MSESQSPFDNIVWPSSLIQQQPRRPISTMENLAALAIIGALIYMFGFFKVLLAGLAVGLSFFLAVEWFANTTGPVALLGFPVILIGGSWFGMDWTLRNPKRNPFDLRDTPSDL